MRYVALPVASGDNDASRAGGADIVELVSAVFDPTQIGNAQRFEESVCALLPSRCGPTSRVLEPPLRSNHPTLGASHQPAPVRSLAVARSLAVNKSYSSSTWCSHTLK
jgi:hypothetical protein